MHRFATIAIFFTLVFFRTNLAGFAAERPDTFVSLQTIEPTIVIDMRYFGQHNFVGRPIEGYRAGKCYLTHLAAQALKDVQAELKPFFLSLKVYDCYRPQRAVNDFVQWAKNTSDTKMAQEFYPRVLKSVLFREGYIAEKSGHSRGSTVDLTLVPVPQPPDEPYSDKNVLRDCTLTAGKRFRDNSIDMGSGYDCFDPLSHTANPAVEKVALQNRLLLKTVMEKHGFQNYDKEWWHYTLKNEPYPQTFFDFEIR